MSDCVKDPEEDVAFTAIVEQVMVFTNTLYGGPFHEDRICPWCGERNGRPVDEPCQHCGREGET